MSDSRILVYVFTLVLMFWISCEVVVYNRDI